MRYIFKYLLFSLVTTFTPCTSEAKEWKGIKPLFSTKTDVEKILGAPSETNQFRSIYDLENESIYIVFASDDDSNYECVRQLKAGTVLLIKVTPKKKMKFSDSQFDKFKLKPLKPLTPTNVGYESYIDEENGLIIRTLNGNIDVVNYIANVTDKKVCEEYYSKPEVFVQVMVNPQNNNKQMNISVRDPLKRKNSKRTPRKPLNRTPHNISNNISPIKKPLRTQAQSK